MKKSCTYCQKSFKKKSNESLGYWNAKLFCSRFCYGISKKGVIPSHVKLWRKGIRVSPQTEFKKGQVSMRTGAKQPQTRDQLEKRVKALSRGKNHWNWKGGVTPINERIRKSLEYKQWRMAVFQRDRFTCTHCGLRSQGKDIRADHIKPFSLYPELRLVIDNGRTLCISCDLKLGWNYKRDKNQFIVGQNL